MPKLSYLKALNRALGDETDRRLACIRLLREVIGGHVDDIARISPAGGPVDAEGQIERAVGAGRARRAGAQEPEG